MRRLLAIALAASLGSGCFVNEELAEGERIMDEHFGHTEGRADLEERQRERERSSRDWRGNARNLQRSGEGAVARVKRWWNAAWTPSPSDLYRDDPIVNCLVGGTTQYVRRSDCRLRDGRESGPPR